MTASVGGEAKDRDKETTPVEDAKPGGVSELMFRSVSILIVMTLARPGVH